MKKIITVIMAAVLCFSAAGCSSKIEEKPATDTEKNAAFETVTSYLTSDEFKAHADLYRTTFAREPAQPQVLAGYTFRCDVEGFDMDLLLLSVKADIAVDHSGEIYGYEKIQIIIDNKSGTVYNSAEYMAKQDNFDGVINSEETAVMMLMNSHVLIEGSDNYLWSETEESSKFTSDDIKEINAAING